MQKGRLRWSVHTPHLPFNQVRKMSIYLPLYAGEHIYIYVSVLVSSTWYDVADDIGYWMFCTTQRLLPFFIIGRGKQTAWRREYMYVYKLRLFASIQNIHCNPATVQFWANVYQRFVLFLYSCGETETLR